MPKSVTHLTTPELVERCQGSFAPDRSAFAELVRRHHAHLDRLVYCLVPNYPERDVLMRDIWVVAHDQIHQLQVPGQFRRWLSRTAAQWVIKKLNLATASAPTTVLGKVRCWLRSQPTSPVIQPAPLPLLITDLPDAIRITVLLRDMGGFCYDTIAEITNVSVDTVKMRLAQARQQLKGQLPHLQQDLA